MFYTYDAVVIKDGDGYSVSFPQFPDAFTFGETREEAALRAAEVLQLILAEHIEDGIELPQQERVAEVFSVGVSITSDDIDQSKCMTINQAAEALDLTPGRVSQLASNGKLQAVTFGKKRMVTIASVNERLNCSKLTSA